MGQWKDMEPKVFGLVQPLAIVSLVGSSSSPLLHASSVLFSLTSSLEGSPSAPMCVIIIFRLWGPKYLSQTQILLLGSMLDI